METTAYSYIRFSRPEQLKGNSLQRQLEASRNYAKEHNLILDETMQDLGLSAFHGIHKVKGALGRFLKLVEQGNIKRGSYLIVENLDRLSRQEVLEALNQFTSLIQAGIVIVTLQDSMTYSKESITDNWAQLIISITYMARAFDESKRKSQRLSATWENKLEKAHKGEKKLTRNCPNWLTLSEDRKTFKINKEAAIVINLIYDKKLEGKGSQRIAKELNQTNLWKPRGKRGKPDSWGISYVDRILHNDRRLIGEFQPAVRVGGKRIKHGEPIPDYFPVVVPVEKFNRVQAQIKHNREISGYAGGRNDKLYNLFGHIAICYYCGYSMLYRNQGSPPKGGQFFVCNKRVRGLQCRGNKLMYDIVEDNILLFCHGLNVSDILPSNNETMLELSNLQKQLQSFDGEILDINNRLENLYDTIEVTSNPTIRESLNHRASALVLKREKLIDQKAETTRKLERLQNGSKTTSDHLASIRDLIDKMKKLEGAERIELRLNLKNQLRKLIKVIKIDTIQKKAYVFFNSGLRRGINLQTSEIMMEAFMKKKSE